jgi:hypothetical protein
MACVIAMALMAGCQRVAELPTSARVWLEDPSGHMVPAPDVLVLAKRVNACNGGFLSTPSTTGIDAYALRTDSSGAVELPPGTYRYACSFVYMDTKAFKPGYYSQSSLVPDEKKPGTLRHDVILIPRIVDESRGQELAGILYSAFSSYTVSEDMRRQIYAEMLPEIFKLAEQTESWHSECYRVGWVAEKVDVELGRTTCRYYQYRGASE